MIKPFQQTGKPVTGQEYVLPGEEDIIAEMVLELKEQVERMYAGKKMLRQVHTKMHGCVQATFTVEKNLDPALQVGVFKQATAYPAWIRFSNASTLPQADGKKDIRGFAIKLMQVPGEKILDDQRDEPTQDFLLMSSETFFSKNLAEFRKLLKPAVAKSKLAFLPYLLNPMHWGVLKRVKKSNVACNHPLELTYWSTQPYQFGDPHRAVKYMVRPSPSNQLVTDNTTEPDYLRTNLAATLTQHDASFDFCIQLQENAETMPIENPTVPWASRFIKLATIHIPVQECNTPELMEFGDNLSFNPWHSLPEHRPLGSFNRARKRAYEELSLLRHEHNNLPMTEPTADTASSDSNTNQQQPVISIPQNQTTMDAPVLDELFVITATLNPPVMEGHRILAMINGGDVQGKISGKVLPIGGEFGSFIAPDTYKIDVRAAIQSTDGAVIYITYSGYMHADPDKLKMLFSPEGHKLDPSEYYWRTNPLFETAAPQYAWLNNTVGVGVGSYTPEGKVQYKIYAVK